MSKWLYCKLQKKNILIYSKILYRMQNYMNNQAMENKIKTWNYNNEKYIYVWTLAFKNVFERSLLCPPRLHLFNWKYSKNCNIVKHYHLKWLYVIYSVMERWIFSRHYSSVSHDPSEIIPKCRFFDFFNQETLQDRHFCNIHSDQFYAFLLNKSINL